MWAASKFPAGAMRAGGPHFSVVTGCEIRARGRRGRNERNHSTQIQTIPLQGSVSLHDCVGPGDPSMLSAALSGIQPWACGQPGGPKRALGPHHAVYWFHLPSCPNSSVTCPWQKCMRVTAACMLCIISASFGPRETLNRFIYPVL